MQPLTRRQLLQWSGAAALASPAITLARFDKEEKKEEGFSLGKLPYEFDALEPHIDARTMEIHYGRHHKAYVDNLNNALKGKDDLLGMKLVDLVANLDKVPEAGRMAVRNNGGGHLNHTMFWQMMSKKGGGEPKGGVGKAIDAAFGSFDKFQDAFSKAGLGRFGSGWVWLVPQGEKLAIVSTPNQDTPVMGKIAGLTGAKPILGLDVWEHAYYLKYQNKRADYIKAWWNVVNWEEVAERFQAAKKE